MQSLIATPPRVRRVCVLLAGKIKSLLLVKEEMSYEGLWKGTRSVNRTKPRPVVVRRSLKSGDTGATQEQEVAGAADSSTTVRT